MGRIYIDRGVVESRFHKELERLQRFFDVGYDLRVVWKPDLEKNMDGEVINETILLYCEEKQGIMCLRHEFFHYLISKVSQKYKRIMNIQRKFINNFLESLAEEAYHEEEEFIEKMVMMLDALDTIENRSS